MTAAGRKVFAGHNTKGDIDYPVQTESPGIAAGSTEVLIISVEQNKELVTKTWNAFVKGDIKSAFANMSDEISWLIPGAIPNLSGLKRARDPSIG